MRHEADTTKKSLVWAHAPQRPAKGPEDDGTGAPKPRFRRGGEMPSQGPPKHMTRSLIRRTYSRDVSKTWTETRHGQCKDETTLNESMAKRYTSRSMRREPLENHVGAVLSLQTIGVSVCDHDVTVCIKSIAIALPIPNGPTEDRPATPWN